MERAQRVREAMGGLSEKQRAKIEHAFRSNIDRLAGSDFFQGMQADIEMFGQEAFSRPKDEDNDR